jgi:hypothetical protein
VCSQPRSWEVSVLDWVKGKMNSDVFMTSTHCVHLEVCDVPYFEFSATGMTMKHWTAVKWGSLFVYFVSFTWTCLSNDVKCIQRHGSLPPFPIHLDLSTAYSNKESPGTGLWSLLRTSQLYRFNVRGKDQNAQIAKLSERWELKFRGCCVVRRTFRANARQGNWQPQCYRNFGDILPTSSRKPVSRLACTHWSNFCLITFSHIIWRGCVHLT